MDSETDSELELELAPAPDLVSASATALGSDSAQQAPVDLVPPARLQELRTDSKLQFLLLPVCVVVNDDRAQRCEQA